MPVRRWYPAIVGVLAVASSIAGIRNDFVYDDVPLIRDNARVQALNLADIFRHAYWPPPFVEQLYRPFAELVLGVEYLAGHGAPVVFRLVSYALYALCAVLTYRLALRLVSPAAALAVACLFAVHPVHVEAVALGVNQGELIVAACCLVAVTLYVDRRRAGALSGKDWTVIALVYVVAILTKENGVVLPLLLGAADMTLLRDAPAPSRGTRVAGYAVLAAIFAAYFLVRSAVLTDLEIAAVPIVDLRHLSLGGRMLVMLHVVPHWLRLLAWPHHLQVDFAPGEIARPGEFGAGGALGLAIVVAFIALVVWEWRRSRRLTFALLWLAVALLPVSNIVPTGVLLAERTLFLPSVGFVLALGVVAEWLIARHAFGRATPRILVACAAVLLVLGFVRSANRQSVWNSWHLVRRVVQPPR